MVCGLFFLGTGIGVVSGNCVIMRAEKRFESDPVNPRMYFRKHYLNSEIMLFRA